MATTELTTLPLAAQRLGVPWSMAYKYVLSGRLEGRFEHGRWLVTVASLAALVVGEGTESGRVQAR